MEKTNEENKLIPIQDMIYEIRGLKVMIDRDLADLYGVEVKRLNEAVKRNIRRFPPDFMFQLTNDEFKEVVAICDHLQDQKYRSTMPFVFTEHGILMLSSVIRSDQAIDVNINIMRAFVQMRHYMLTQSNSSEENAELRKLLMLHIDNCDYKFYEYDETIGQIMETLNNLTEKPKPARRIGFGAD